MKTYLKLLASGMALALILSLSFPPLASATSSQEGPPPPAAPPGKPAEAPKAPPLEPKAFKPPPPPPRIKPPPKKVEYETDEEREKRWAREDAERAAQNRAARIKGEKRQVNQPIQEDTNMKIAGNKLPNTIMFAGNTTVIMDQFGFPIKGTLARESYLWVRLKDLMGRIKSRFVRFAQGTEVTVGTAKDGEDFVVKGTLAEESLLPTGPDGKGAWFKGGTEVSFDVDGGTVRSGTLARDTYLFPEGNWKGQKYPAGTKVSINPRTGNVVIAIPPGK